MNPSNHKLIYAAIMMSVGTTFVKRNNKRYGWLRKKFSESQSGENHIFNKDQDVRQRNLDYMKGPNNPGKNQSKGKDHPLYGRSFDPSCFTPEGLESMAESKRGDKNPMYGIKPWNHGRATEYTKSVWSRADEIRKVWEENDDPAANRLYRLVTGQIYDWKVDKKMICPYMNLVKYFRNQWNPVDDPEWKQFKKENK